MDANKLLVGIVARLNTLSDLDVESSHIEADNLLLEALRFLGAEDVAKAYEDLRERQGFWYA